MVNQCGGNRDFKENKFRLLFPLNAEISKQYITSYVLKPISLVLKFRQKSAMIVPVKDDSKGK